MSSAAPLSWKDLAVGWRKLFLAPRDTRLCDAIRIGYALLLLIDVMVLWLDLERWFSGAGLVPYPVSRQVLDPDALSLFAWLPDTPTVARICALLFTAHIGLLLLGLLTRVQVVCVFVWLVSFQHRNILLVDGEDAVLRMIGFFLIFAPIGRHWALDRRWRKPERTGAPPPSAWALRLIQVQMSLIYLSTAWEKADGADWLDGTAMYYVSRLDDLFGRLPLPAFPFESLLLCQLLSWAVLVLETGLPITLWFRETRRAALVTAVLFHLATDYAMNLFLFHWIMIVGLISFAEPDDWQDGVTWLRRLARSARRLRLRRRPPDDDVGADAPGERNGQ
jgi:hypothetical protein